MLPPGKGCFNRNGEHKTHALAGDTVKGGSHWDSGGQGHAKSPSIDVFTTGQKLDYFKAKQESLPLPFLFLPGFPNLIPGCPFTFNSFTESI